MHEGMRFRLPERNTMSYNYRQLFARLDLLLAADLTVPLTKLAHEIGVSRNTAAKAIRQKTGLPFSKYRDTKLLERAIQLLNERPSMSIKGIAIELGYDSPGSFSRFIRMKTGITPSAIRVSPDYSRR
jgi:AraC-like DNA-binding protein